MGLKSSFSKLAGTNMGDQEPPPDRTLEIRSQLRFPTRMQSRPKRCSTSPQPSAAGDAASPPSCPALPALRPVSLAASALSSPPPLLFIASHSGVVGGGFPPPPIQEWQRVKLFLSPPRPRPPPFSFSCGFSFWGFPFCFSSPPPPPLPPNRNWEDGIHP